MPRPTILVATTNPAMAYALRESLKGKCKSLGLKLEVCPDGDESGIGKDVRIYDSAEALFDALEKRDPMALADTLVVLDVETGLENAFSPAASEDQGWHITKNRAGVAVELMLRFPQVFPVFLSPAVPVPQDGWQSNGDSPIYPISGNSAAGNNVLGDGNWLGYSKLQDVLSTRHMGTPNTASGDQQSERSLLDTLFALTIPLHFVSPLDQGSGLISVLQRFARGMRCWFDPTGLRTLVKNRFLGTVFGDNQEWAKIPQREKILGRLEYEAVTIDEEREFALLGAYTAWKYGRRAWVVTTYKEFHESNLWAACPNERNVTVLRDIDIRFPDVPSGSNGESVRNRIKDITESLWQDKLGEKWKIKAISGEASIIPLTDEKKWKEWNTQEIDWGQRETDGNYEYLGFSKPIASIYELQKLLSCNVRGIKNEYVTLVSMLSGNETETNSKGGHGAPYLNLMIAEALLRYSANCENDGPAHFISALLAMEAYELLLGMSKTTALEALLAMHRHEVIAEVNFPGVSHAIDIVERKKDITLTLDKLYESLNDRTATKKMYLSQFWAELRIAYKNGEQFKAAEDANIESLLNGRWLPLRPFENLLRQIKPISIQHIRQQENWKKLFLYPAMSLWWWLVCAIWISLFFTVWYGALRRSFDLSVSGIYNFFHIWWEVIMAMLTLQPGGGENDITKAATNMDKFCLHFLELAHMAVSYVLLGLLISMLYRKITRA